MKELGTKTLETERLILRKFREEDIEKVYQNWATDPKCCEYLSWNVHHNIEETQLLVKEWISKYADDYFNWVVEIKTTHEIIGNISAIQVKKQHSNCEIGYCYGSKYWNMGYATEALKEVIRFFLDDCELHLVEACHISGNPASGKVMEKAGMHKDAILKDRRRNKKTGQFNDLICYSITK